MDAFVLAFRQLSLSSQPIILLLLCHTAAKTEDCNAQTTLPADFLLGSGNERH